MEQDFKDRISEIPQYREVIRVYTKKWYWFLLGLLFTCTAAYLYLRYATPMYEAKAKIQIIEETGAGSELSLFQDMELLSGENKIEDEIEVLNSRSNFIEVVNQLRTNISITLLGTIKNRELYDKTPITVSFISADSIIKDKRMEFYVDLNSTNSFIYKTNQDDPGEVIEFGKNFITPLGEAVITPNPEHLDRFRNTSLMIRVVPIYEIAELYRENTTISPANKVSNILKLSYHDPIQERAIDILNVLVEKYNENAIADRKAIADKTSLFIEDRIDFIYNNLAVVDESEEDFRTAKGLTDIDSESNINLSVGADIKRELNNTATELNIAESMRSIIADEGEYDLLPANIGLSDPLISNATTKYNQLISERNRLLKSSSEKNPIVINLDQEINGLKKILKSSLNGTIQNLNLQASGLSRQQSRLNSRIYSTPKNQRALRDITRKKETTESLYLYLLQKREEAQITYASSKPKSKIIDYAYGPSELPISPKVPFVYVGAVILGLVVPFSFIFLVSILDNKVRSRISLENIIGDIPVLGELPFEAKTEQRAIIKNDRSALAESMRIINTNLDYLLKKGEHNEGKVIYVTSSIPGEGKTFVASNLASILVQADCKVLIIGADIRNPQIENFFGQRFKKQIGQKNKTLGLTEFLFNDKIRLSDITVSRKLNDGIIDVIYSGKVPPNPAELLKSKRMKELISEVSPIYDYIVVDTAPMMVVSDTLRIMEFSDLTIYVTKAGVTEIKLLEYPIKLEKEGKLNNLAFVVNGVKSSNLGYYGKYGYGYNQKTKAWWRV